MKDHLLKRWFLLVLLAGLGLAWFWPYSLRFLTIHLDLRLAVAATLFLIAVSLENRSLLTSLLRPLPALWAILLSYGAVPALAWFAGWLLPTPDLRVGLMIIASVPCTLAAAVLWTRLAGGNEATALLVVFLTTATSWLATTSWLAFTVGAAVVADPASMMKHLFFVLIVPVALGQLSQALPPVARVVVRHKPALAVVSRLLILTIVLKAVVDVSEQLGNTPSSLGFVSWSSAAVVCIVIHLIALAGGFWTSRLLRLDRPNQIAVAFSCSQKTLPVALDLFVVYFQQIYPLAIVSLVFYHVGQLVVDTFIAEAFLQRRWRLWYKTGSVDVSSEFTA